MKMTISVVRSLERKTMLVWVKEYINKNFETCKSLWNSHELYTAFKEKHSNVNIGLSKFCALRPKWCVLAGSKMAYTVYVCSSHQNVVLLVDAMDWDLTYKDMIKKIVFNSDSNKCVMHRRESDVRTHGNLRQLQSQFWIFWVKKNTPVNFWDLKLFKTEVIKEKVIFTMSAAAHQFAIFNKYKFWNAWS